MAKRLEKQNGKIIPRVKIKPNQGASVINGKKPRKKRDQTVIKIGVFDQFCYWIVRTDEERKAENLPKDQNSFAALHKVDITTLSNWKKQADFENTRMAKMREKLNSKTPDVINALYKRIIKYGMGYEVELWLAYVEGWDKKKVLELGGKVEFGDGDVRALVQYLPKEKQKAFYDTITKLLIEAEHNRAEGKDIGDHSV
jgi:hypothetical protein